MRHAILFLAVLAIASPAWAGHHSSTPSQRELQQRAERADQNVAALQNAINNGPVRPDLLDRAEQALARQEDLAARLHAACGC